MSVRLCVCSLSPPPKRAIIVLDDSLRNADSFSPENRKNESIYTWCICLFFPCEVFDREIGSIHTENGWMKLLAMHRKSRFVYESQDWAVRMLPKITEFCSGHFYVADLFRILVIMII